MENTKKVKHTKTVKENKITEVPQIKETPVKIDMGKLETAYNEAISGKIKFKEVRTVFENLHKEIKKSVKETKK
jgi:hypothetical protein